MAYRFGQAAHAIGVTEAKLRNWMTRNKIDLWGERPEGGWRTFALRDVFVLSLASELVKWGVTVENAVEAVQKLLADTPEHEPHNLSDPLFVCFTKFGEWEIHPDEALALHLSDRRSVLKLLPMQIIAEANNRLVDIVRAAK